MIDTIATKNAVSRLINIIVDDRMIKLDDLYTVEFTEDLFNFGVYGALVFNDMYDICNSNKAKLEGQTKVIIKYFDPTDNYLIRYFTVIDVDIISTERKRVIALKIVDDFTYKLMTTYASSLKTTQYGTDVISAFDSIIKQIGADQILKTDRLSTDFGKAEKHSFIIPSGISILDFFVKEFRKFNIRIWRDNFKLYVKELNLKDLKLRDKPIKDQKGNPIQVCYTNDNINYDCFYHIHDYEKIYANKIDAFPSQIVTRSLDKNTYTETINLDDFYKSLLLNDNKNFKLVQPESQVAETHMSDTLEAQKFDLFNNYIQLNKIRIYVIDNAKDLNIGQIINTKFKAVSQFKEQQSMGDVTASGKYLITQITHKIIKDKVIARVTLSRFDNPQTRKL